MSPLASPRAGRWYDATPHLAFALQCLLLAPVTLRQQVVTQVSRISGKPDVAPPPHARKEDGDLDAFWDAVDGLRLLPETQRQQTADFILQQLKVA